MFLQIHHYKKILVATVVLSCLAAIYCIPFIDIRPQIPKRLPQVRFDYQNSGPLRATSVKDYKISKLFTNQLYGAESIEADSFGNLYLATEGGFILYAQLNDTSTTTTTKRNTGSGNHGQNRPNQPKLWLIAELNGNDQQDDEQQSPTIATTTTSTTTNTDNDRRASSSNSRNNKLSINKQQGSIKSNVLRQCHLDQHLYGQQLSSGGLDGNFKSRVPLSRCSKPLGIRLSENQDYLYVIDTLNGLYKINLREAHENLKRSSFNLLDLDSNTKYDTIDRGAGGAGGGTGSSDIKRKIIEKLLNFNSKTKQSVAIERMDNDIQMLNHYKTMVPVSLKAMDDLVIDSGAGTNGQDVIYMTDASQIWLAVNYIYDLMEARPSGVVLRLDIGSNQLSLLDNKHLSVVRMASSTSANIDSAGAIASSNRWRQLRAANIEVTDQFNNDTIEGKSSDHSLFNTNKGSVQIEAVAPVGGGGGDDEIVVVASDSTAAADWQPGKGYGAPKFDSNDIFDDRPLFFPNGIELMDDKQALLIADTSNKRIIKHFIRGPRKGQSDLWTWTPHHPDNIRRGSRIISSSSSKANDNNNKDNNKDNKQQDTTETYWTAGCGRDKTNDTFMQGLINEETFINWPRVRLFMLKNIYLFGWTIEKFGQFILRSRYLTDLGYSLKMGLPFLDNFCDGLMILQYNRHGEIIKTIHGRDFPDDMKLLSQITEIVDPNDPMNHILYLGTPSYNYVYRINYRVQPPSSP